MANSNTPYTREGDINAWNDLIRKINLQAEECDLEPLEEVDENHILAKSDIRDAQDKLVEACIDNEFRPIPDRWLVQTIQELEDIAASEPCCCEEQEIVFPVLFSFLILGIQGVIPGGEVIQGAMFDWAGWIMQEREPLVITQVDCGEDPDTGEPIEPVETRTGGRGWVGTEFRIWEMFLSHPNDPDPSHITEPIITGNIIDGYIQPGEGTPKFLNKCGEPENSGTPLGENDPNWTFRYRVQTIDGPGPLRIQIFSLNTDFRSPTLFGWDLLRQRGFAPIATGTPPFTIETFPDIFSSQAFLRVKCVSGGEG